MYLTIDALKLALEELKPFHPFFGQTFLVFKKGNLPQERVTEFPIEKNERSFLTKHYKPFKNVDAYYRVMRANQPRKAWNASKYPSAGSQATRTKGKVANALLHEDRTSLWGWKKGYIDILKELLPEQKPVPAFLLAVWLYREENWPEKTQPASLVEKFAREFKITKYEATLFSRELPSLIDGIEVFQADPITEDQLKQIIEPYNDESTLDAEDVFSFLQSNNFSSDTPAIMLAKSWFQANGLDDPDLYGIINGILYHLKTGFSWDQIPEEFGSPHECQLTYRHWLENGTWGLIWQNIFEHFEDGEKLSWASAFLNGNFSPFSE